MTAETMFQIANLVALAGWLVLLASPFIPTLADRVSGVIIPLLLALAYCALVIAFFGQSDGGFDSLENVTKLFTTPEAVLVGWLHYLAFDLFIGAWEVRTARAENIPFPLVIPCLALTFIFGPAGLLAFMTLRGGYGLARRT